MTQESLPLKPSGSTIAAILMGLLLLVYLALSAPSWPIAPYLEAVVVHFIVYMSLTDRTNSAGQGYRNGSAAESEDIVSAGETLECCLETAHACHQAGESIDDGDWGCIDAGYCDCEFY